MPSPFSGIIQDLRARDSKATTQQDVMMRMIEQQQRMREAEAARRAWGLYQNQNSPSAQREKRLALHAADVKAQDDAWVQAALQLRTEDVPAEWRGRLQLMQKYIAGNAVNSAKVAQDLVRASKPHAIQKLTSQTLDDEGNALNSYEIYDPNNPGLSAMPGFGGSSSGSPIGGGGGTRPAVAAPTLPSRVMRPAPRTRADAAADHFMGHPAFSEPPPPAPVGAGPPSIPGWED